MATSHDYTADHKLDCLPMALRQRMVATQQARIDAGFTAKNGMTHKDAAGRDVASAAFDSRAKGE